MTDTGKRRVSQVYSRAQIQAIKALCNPRYPTGCRDLALLSTLHESGIRISEALDLLPEDVKDGSLHIQHGKGDRARWVGIGTGAEKDIARWLAARSALEIGASAPVFCTLKGTRQSYQAVDQMLKRRAAKAGISGRVHLHGIRHSHAVALDTGKVPPTEIQRQLGHSRLSTTMTYLNHVSPARLTESVKGVFG
jgi:integrase/recombinase XerC